MEWNKKFLSLQLYLMMEEKYIFKFIILVQNIIYDKIYDMYKLET